jgi:hypothetical protein
MWSKSERGSQPKLSKKSTPPPCDDKWVIIDAWEGRIIDFIASTVEPNIQYAPHRNVTSPVSRYFVMHWGDTPLHMFTNYIRGGGVIPTGFEPLSLKEPNAQHKT